MVKYDANVVVHVDEKLKIEQINEIKKELSKVKGVVSTCVHVRISPSLFDRSRPKINSHRPAVAGSQEKIPASAQFRSTLQRKVSQYVWLTF